LELIGEIEMKLKGFIIIIIIISIIIIIFFFIIIIKELYMNQMAFVMVGDGMSVRSMRDQHGVVRSHPCYISYMTRLW